MERVTLIFLVTLTTLLYGCAATPTASTAERQLYPDASSYPWIVEASDEYSLAYMCSNCSKSAHTLFNGLRWPSTMTDLEKKLWTEIIITHILFKDEERRWASKQAMEKRTSYLSELMTLAKEVYGKSFSDMVVATVLRQRIGDASGTVALSTKSPFRLPSPSELKPGADRQNTAIMMTLVLRNALASSRMTIFSLNTAAANDMKAMEDAYRQMKLARTYTPPILTTTKAWMKKEVKWRMAAQKIAMQ